MLEEWDAEMLMTQDFKDKLSTAINDCMNAINVGSKYYRIDYIYGPYRVKVYLVGKLVRVDISYAV